MWSKKGFTITELVVAMMLVAGIAMILMPSLVSNNEKQVYATALKKLYAQLQQTNQAVGMLQARGRIPQGAITITTYKNAVEQTTNLIAPIDANDTDTIKNQKNQKKNSYLSGYSGVIPASCTLPTSDTMKEDNCTSALILKNGMFLFFDSVKIDGVNRGLIIADINGKKPPNTPGKDIFYFSIKDNAIVPLNAGCATKVSGKDYCSQKDATTGIFKNDCTGCAYRILEGDGNGKIDYF